LSEKQEKKRPKNKLNAEAAAPPHDRITNAVTDLLHNIQTTADYRCVNHPARIATAVCESCGADLCARCYVIRRNKIMCAKCMTFRDEVLAGSRFGGRIKKLLIHPLTLAVVLAVVLANILLTCGKIQRKGLLGGGLPANTAEAEERFRLETILFLQKAYRIEEYADSLKAHGRSLEATQEYERARLILESMKVRHSGRWEEHAIALACARLLSKAEQQQSAVAIYEKLVNLSGDDKTFPVIAEFHLAQLLEDSQPDQALAIYKRLVKDVRFVPETFSRFLNVMARPEGPYNYETRIASYTRTNFDFETVEYETFLKMGHLLISLNRHGDAEYWLWLIVDAIPGSRTAEEARLELRRIESVQRGTRNDERQNEVEVERKEKVEIIHFE